MRPHHKQTVKQQYTQVSYPISPVAYKTAPLAPSIDTPYLTVVSAYELLGVMSATKVIRYLIFTNDELSADDLFKMAEELIDQ